MIYDMPPDKYRDQIDTMIYEKYGQRVCDMGLLQMMDLRIEMWNSKECDPWRLKQKSVSGSANRSKPFTLIGWEGFKFGVPGFYDKPMRAWMKEWNAEQIQSSKALELKRSDGNLPTASGYKIGEALIKEIDKAYNEAWDGNIYASKSVETVYWLNSKGIVSFDGGSDIQSAMGVTISTPLYYGEAAQATTERPKSAPFTTGRRVITLD